LVGIALEKGGFDDKRVGVLNGLKQFVGRHCLSHHHQAARPRSR
jgi:hypothetical protein